MALQPEAAEADHHGAPSFRVTGKIFCILSQDLPRFTIKLTSEDQENLAAGYPGVIEPVPGYWGRKGSTVVWCDPKPMTPTLLHAPDLAWGNVAPKRLLKTPEA